jgi:hypothetical protein
MPRCSGLFTNSSMTRSGDAQPGTAALG